MLEKLETLGWPQPFAEALDPYEDQRVAEFQTAFVDLLTLEHLCVICPRGSDAKQAHPARACVACRQANNPIPASNKLSQSVSASSSRPKPLLALQPLVHPLLLRFKWQFEGSRGTNRIDKVRLLFPIMADRLPPPSLTFVSVLCISRSTLYRMCSTSSLRTSASSAKISSISSTRTALSTLTLS